MSEATGKTKTDRAGEQATSGPSKPASSAPNLPKEIGGRKGPEPIRYGDWEKNGRCIDF